MGDPHKKSELMADNIGTKKESLQTEPENVSLEDMSLETRRKEANKPLFLVRYE
jgi:hypothetical protein